VTPGAETLKEDDPLQSTLGALELDAAIVTA
jgi:hypothetical protein